MQTIDLFDHAVKLLGFCGNATVNDSPGLVEAARRTTVSRAYYACYHDARRLAMALGYDPRRRETPEEREARRAENRSLGGVHERLWRWLEENGADFELLQRATNLKMARSKADYSLDSPFDFDPLDCLAQMERFQRDLYRYVSSKLDMEDAPPESSPPRSQ